MYINAGNAAYSVSTAFTRLNDIKFSISHNRKTTSVDSLSNVTANILHEHHNIWRVEIAICICSNRELGAAVYLRNCQGNQISKQTRDRRSIVEYPLIQGLSPLKGIVEII
jgi:hypothetical protein